AIGAFVRVNEAPSSFALSAVFHAIEFSSRAPKMMPRFPFKRLLAICISVISVSGAIIRNYGEYSPQRAFFALYASIFFKGGPKPYITNRKKPGGTIYNE